MARSFNHPSAKEISVDGILHALSDPIRRTIIARLMDCKSMSCNKACDELSPSTISFHHKILRESGLIRSEKIGVQVINSVRFEEVEKKFPGLLATILKHHREK